MRNLFIILCLVTSSMLNGQTNQRETQSVLNSDSTRIVENLFFKKVGKVLTPVSLNWQFAGNIGMHSVGAEWNIYKNVLRAGLMLGYVPDSRSIEPLFVGTIQIKYSPDVRIKLTDAMDIKPLNFTLNFSSTYGERFSIYNDNDYYPDNYYWWNVRTRYGLAYDLEVIYSFKSRFAKGISFYLNTSTWDVEFYSVIGNDNLELDRIPYKRLFTLGIGTKIYLN